jgi:hypothetical protein
MAGTACVGAEVCGASGPVLKKSCLRLDQTGEAIIAVHPPFVARPWLLFRGSQGCLGIS